MNVLKLGFFISLMTIQASASENLVKTLQCTSFQKGSLIKTVAMYKDLEKQYPNNLSLRVTLIDGSIVSTELLAPVSSNDGVSQGLKNSILGEGTITTFFTATNGLGSKAVSRYSMMSNTTAGGTYSAAVTFLNCRKP